MFKEKRFKLGKKQNELVKMRIQNKMENEVEVRIEKRFI